MLWRWLCTVFCVQTLLGTFPSKWLLVLHGVTIPLAARIASQGVLQIGKICFGRRDSTLTAVASKHLRL